MCVNRCTEVWCRMQQPNRHHTAIPYLCICGSVLAAVCSVGYMRMHVPTYLRTYLRAYVCACVRVCVHVHAYVALCCFPNCDNRTDVYASCPHTCAYTRRWHRVTHMSVCISMYCVHTDVDRCLVEGQGSWSCQNRTRPPTHAPIPR